MTDKSGPRVEELQDNIDTSDVKVAPKEQNAPKLAMMNISQACEIIANKYQRGFKHLKFTLPVQIHDGCIVEFIDDELRAQVASGKLRFTNQILLNSDSELQLVLKVSDISFERPFVDLTVNCSK